MAGRITIDLPETLLEQLESAAQSQRRSVAEMLREFVIDHWSATPKLPDDVEAELAALPRLSDETLWLVARHTLTQDERQTLANLNQEAKERDLSHVEKQQRESLLNQYDRMMVRRAQAARILKDRGHDLSDPAILQAP
jgi:rhodanese-related sulfurtransferase